MLGGSGDLAEIQDELRSVKKALQTGTGYLGMQGENLQKYLLQLNEKENLMLSQQIQSLSVSAPAAGGGTNGSGVIAAPAAPSPGIPAKPPPPGEAKAFNRDDLASIVQHLCDYEAVPQECAKALRALSTLAYQDAAKIGNHDAAMQQLMRLLALHPEDVSIKQNAMRVLCNVAYDPVVATQKLATPQVLTALFREGAELPGEKDKGAAEAIIKAGEAAARIVAAETCPDGNNAATEMVLPEAESPLARFLLVACALDSTSQLMVPRLLSQMVANEVAVVDFFVARFVAVGTAAANAGTALGWLTLARVLASAEGIEGLAQSLVDRGCIRTAVLVMEQAAADAAAQLAGVEALSGLVGNRYSGLTAFAESGGMVRIEKSMATHTDAMMLQTKSIRAMASGVLWTMDVQRRAQYEPLRALTLTKQAMAAHMDNAELQQAGLEAISKYLDKLKCKTEVLQDGGEDLVKQSMTRHVNEKPVMLWGRNVLDALGVDSAWTPGK
mmetsp:Transcript_109313/g.315947  ORF Transcript_109313/g.315947 Transcript_109313/m.315947 type:complete len:499 (+) Transcript_109313:75-1571(+)